MSDIGDSDDNEMTAAIFGIGVGLQFYGYVLRKRLSFVEFADFSQIFDDGYVL